MPRAYLVDLAHSPGRFDRSGAGDLDSSRWCSRTAGSTQRGPLARSPMATCSVVSRSQQAKKIAARGGVIGLWGLAPRNPGPSRTPGHGHWTVGRGDTRAYARELAHLVALDRRRPCGVSAATSNGVGRSWSVNDYVPRAPASSSALQAMKLPGERDREGRLRELRPGAEGRALRRPLNHTRGGFSPSVANARSTPAAPASLEKGLQVRQASRRPAEAAGPAAEDEGIGIADAEGFAEQPGSAMARELGVELVEHRADLGLGVRLDLRRRGSSPQRSG